MPQKHEYVFILGEISDYRLYFFFNDGKGYISTNDIMWFGDEMVSASSNADIPNLLPCRYSTNEWNSLPLEKRLWEQKYPSNDCEKKRSGAIPASEQTKQPITDEHIDAAVGAYKWWIDISNVTENILKTLKDDLKANEQEIERFFETYPELKGQSFLPTNFFTLPKAFAIDYPIYGYGEFLIEDMHGNLVSPIGMKICLYDLLNDGTHKVLKDGLDDACKIMTSSNGVYSITTTNKDPDGDGTGVDLTVGITSDNEIVKLTDYGINHGTGEIYKEYADTTDVVNDVSTASSQIIKLPDAKVGNTTDFARAYNIIKEIFEAHKFMELGS